MAVVLVIDDDQEIRRLLRRILERAGHGVQEAGSGLEGIQKYRSDPADLVITDIVMPEKEGLETIQELRRDFPDAKIIAMSGGGRIGPKGYLKLAEKLGAARAFSKPFDRMEMVTAVDELLAS